jgi:hypothetical protein
MYDCTIYAGGLSSMSQFSAFTDSTQRWHLQIYNPPKSFLLWRAPCHIVMYGFAFSSHMPNTTGSFFRIVLATFKNRGITAPRPLTQENLGASRSPNNGGSALLWHLDLILPSSDVVLSASYPERVDETLAACIGICFSLSSYEPALYKISAEGVICS